MRLAVLVFLLIIIGNFKSIGQTVYDLTTAKAIALAENKLIILDFWATWCKPCLKMDEELWNDERFKKLNNKFVLLKIDVMKNRELARQYEVQSIPRVLIITATEDQLFDKKGYSGSKSYLQVFNAFPDAYGSLSRVLEPFVNKKTATSMDQYKLGETYREIGNKIEDDGVKNQFLSQSKHYFKKCEKATNSEELKQLAILSQIRNDAYLGKYKKVKKKLNKFGNENQQPEVSSLKNFILAYCHRQQGNLKEMQNLKGKIENEALLSELNDGVTP